LENMIGGSGEPSGPIEESAFPQMGWHFGAKHGEGLTTENSAN